MSKGHHTTRRRTYGRRQHELHQREDADQSVWRETWNDRPEPAFSDERWRVPDEPASWSRPGARD